MVQIALLLAAVLGVVTLALIVVLMARRGTLARRGREAARLERELTPLALELADGGDVAAADGLSMGQAEALARVLSRYSRQLSADVREEIGAFFERAGFVDRQLEMLRSRRGWQRGAAAKALGEMGARRAVPALVAALGDTDTDVRAQAAASLGRLDAEEAVGPLVRMLASNLIPRSVGGSALLAIGTGSVPALRALVQAADERVRAVSVELLGLLGGPADIDRVGEALRDPSAEVRARSCRALARLGGTDEHEAALRGLLRDRIGFVRAAAASALRAAGDRGADDLLVEQARHDDFEAAAAAAARALAALSPARVLSEASGPSPGPHLLEAADRVSVGAVE